jgi:tetratricopeptide (TPR) repeat protein
VAGQAVTKVFVSSTAKDLAAYRDAVIEAIHDLDGYDSVRMETFGARDLIPLELCREKVRECRLFVGILGLCYGSSPPDDPTSFTEQEYGEAKELGLPRLMFVSTPDLPIPGNLIEPDDLRQKQSALRENVGKERVCQPFDTPAVLTQKVIAAIHNWEDEERRKQQAIEPTAKPGQEETARDQARVPHPPAPYLAHPYPLQANFTGRVAERRMLTEWFTAGNRNVMVLEAIGGMGKSAVSWVWLLADVMGEALPDVSPAAAVVESQRPEAVVWWSFYEREAGFPPFVDHTLGYLGIDPTKLESLHDRWQALWNVLRTKRVLLVLDGFERELRAYASLGAAYQGDEGIAKEEDPRACVDPAAAAFLRAIGSAPMAGRVLISSRLLPKELENAAGLAHQRLSGFNPEDAVAFFHAQGVKGTRAEIEAVCAPLENHPLFLRLLTGLAANDFSQPGDVRALDRIDIPDEIAQDGRRHHILEAAYNALGDDRQALLSRIAAFRSPVDRGTLAVIQEEQDAAALNAALRELVGRGLLFFDRDTARFDLHPMVRRFAYNRLTDPEGVHARLRDYFASISEVDTTEAKAVDDLTPVIELYHHTVRAGLYDQGCDLYYDRLGDPLYYRFGAYALVTELLRALFPDGEEKLPRLKGVNDQAWALSTLANAYVRSGQNGRAVPLIESAIVLHERADHKHNLAIGLSNLVLSQIQIGKLEEAERNLRRSIKLCREIENAYWEGSGHAELGRLLTYRGLFGKAAKELDAAASGFEEIKQIQYQGFVEAYRAQRALLMGRTEEGLAAARRARKLADEYGKKEYPVPRDLITAEWLQGCALVTISDADEEGHDGRLVEAERHLHEALALCRRINNAEMEPEILLAWVRWHRLKGDRSMALTTATEALEIADRCEYRLLKADIHNFLARLALDEGDRAKAKEHAEIAKERAWCDGPPYHYKPAYEEAERLLAEAQAT